MPVSSDSPGRVAGACTRTGRPWKKPPDIGPPTPGSLRRASAGIAKAKRAPASASPAIRARPRRERSWIVMLGLRPAQRAAGRLVLRRRGTWRKPGVRRCAGAHLWINARCFTTRTCCALSELLAAAWGGRVGHDEESVKACESAIGGFRLVHALLEISLVASQAVLLDAAFAGPAGDGVAPGLVELAFHDQRHGHALAWASYAAPRIW